MTSTAVVVARKRLRLAHQLVALAPFDFIAEIVVDAAGPRQPAGPPVRRRRAHRPTVWADEELGGTRASSRPRWPLGEPPHGGR